MNFRKLKTRKKMLYRFVFTKRVQFVEFYKQLLKKLLFNWYDFFPTNSVFSIPSLGGFLKSFQQFCVIIHYDPIHRSGNQTKVKHLITLSYRLSDNFSLLIVFGANYVNQWNPYFYATGGISEVLTFIPFGLSRLHARVDAKT